MKVAVSEAGEPQNSLSIAKIIATTLTASTAAVVGTGAGDTFAQAMIRSNQASPVVARNVGSVEEIIQQRSSENRFFLQGGFQLPLEQQKTLTQFLTNHPEFTVVFLNDLGTDRYDQAKKQLEKGFSTHVVIISANPDKLGWLIPESFKKSYGAQQATASWSPISAEAGPKARSKEFDKAVQTIIQSVERLSQRPPKKSEAERQQENVAQKIADTQRYLSEVQRDVQQLTQNYPLSKNGVIGNPPLAQWGQTLQNSRIA